MRYLNKGETDVKAAAPALATNVSSSDSVLDFEFKKDVENLSNEVSPTHTDLLVGLDAIERTWIEQLKAVRENTLVIEKQAIACVARVRDDIARLHLLGLQVTKEAERGQEACKHLAESLAHMKGDRA
jgi:hypothetical protein